MPRLVVNVTCADLVGRNHFNFVICISKGNKDIFQLRGWCTKKGRNFSRTISRSVQNFQ